RRSVTELPKIVAPPTPQLTTHAHAAGVCTARGNSGEAQIGSDGLRRTPSTATAIAKLAGCIVAPAIRCSVEIERAAVVPTCRHGDEALGCRHARRCRTAGRTTIAKLSGRVAAPARDFALRRQAAR